MKKKTVICSHRSQTSCNFRKIGFLFVWAMLYNNIQYNWAKGRENINEKNVKSSKLAEKSKPKSHSYL